MHHWFFDEADKCCVVRCSRHLHNYSMDQYARITTIGGAFFVLVNGVRFQVESLRTSTGREVMSVQICHTSRYLHPTKGILRTIPEHIIRFREAETLQ